MKTVSLKIAGEIVNHLSVTIPSNIFALNELTKNSYDAFATEIEIEIDIQNSKLTIKDNGIGMNENDIDKLFHIANSIKTYGKKNKFNNLTRYVQGSKGLGFLSAFKFGDLVQWETNKDGKKIKFLTNKSEIIEKADASQYKTELIITDSDDIGTTITIDLDKKKLDALNEYFRDEKNAIKIVNSFYDKSINLKLKLLNNIYSSIPVSSFLDEGENFQFCFMSYDSTSSILKTFRNQKELKKDRFQISSKDYTIKVDIMVYHFKNGNPKKTDISKLFYRDSDDALSPLLYINDNLFNNDKYFNTEINRKKRSSESMPQMTGYVRVYCSNQSLDFNSDRTNFVETEITKSIINDLYNLNSFIQKKASSIKNTEKNDNNGVIFTGKAYPRQDNVKDLSEIRTAVINLKIGKERTILIPSKQIDLKEYITSVTNSSGEKVDLHAIEFLVDNEKNNTNIIPSITLPCEKKIIFNYYDDITGKVSEELKLSFIHPEATIKGQKRNQLFTFFSNEYYTINIPIVSSLINQVQKIYNEKKSDFYEIIACTLRSILEISVDFLRTKFPHIFEHKHEHDNKNLKEYKSDNLLWNIVQVIHFIKTHDNLKTLIAKILNINYSSLNKHLNINSYSDAVNQAHLGAHKSTVYLTYNDIQSMAKQIGHFAVYCDVMLYKLDENYVSSLELVPFCNT